MAAVKNSNLDIGARTIEFNRAEYLVRALGYINYIGGPWKKVWLQSGTMFLSG